MDQVDIEGTGVVTRPVLDAVRRVVEAYPHLPIIADSRRSLRGFPPVIFKMNAAELARFAGRPVEALDEIRAAAADLARANQRPVFITLAERGIVGAAAATAKAAVAAPAAATASGRAAAARWAAAARRTAPRRGLHVADSAAKCERHKGCSINASADGRMLSSVGPVPRNRA